MSDIECTSCIVCVSVSVFLSYTVIIYQVKVFVHRASHLNPEKLGSSWDSNPGPSDTCTLLLLMYYSTGSSVAGIEVTILRSVLNTTMT